MIKTVWIDRGFKAKNKPDKRYPKGIDLDVTKGAEKFCKVTLPYPAKQCGYWVIECDCGHRSVVTTAGRKDDPRSIKIPCKDLTY